MERHRVHAQATSESSFFFSLESKTVSPQSHTHKAAETQYIGQQLAAIPSPGTTAK